MKKNKKLFEIDNQKEVIEKFERAIHESILLTLQGYEQIDNAQGIDKEEKISQENYNKLLNYRNLSFEEFLRLLCENEIKNKAFFPSQKVGVLLAFYLLKNKIYPESYRYENDFTFSSFSNTQVFKEQQAYVFKGIDERKFFLPSFNISLENLNTDMSSLKKEGENANLLVPLIVRIKDEIEKEVKINQQKDLPNHFVLGVYNMDKTKQDIIINSFNKDRFKELNLQNPLDLKQQNDGYTCGLHMINSLVAVLTGNKEKCEEMEGVIERVKNKEIEEPQSTGQSKTPQPTDKGIKKEEEPKTQTPTTDAANAKKIPQPPIEEPETPKSEMKNLIIKSLKKRAKAYATSCIFLPILENKIQNTFLSLFSTSVNNFPEIKKNKKISYNDYF